MTFFFQHPQGAYVDQYFILRIVRVKMQWRMIVPKYLNYNPINIQRVVEKLIVNQQRIFRPFLVVLWDSSESDPIDPH
ncbi:hypothetical protein SAMN05216308_11131 [Nitrosospira sp. Nsp13]|nr:hypothetical protein SAMN05216308_11131 [Nitrosospira sp. Nsp13]